MEYVGNYIKIKKENVDIVPEKGTKSVSYYVECYDRTLLLLLNDSLLSDEDLREIYTTLDYAYIDWHEEDTECCCEEYMIDKLDTYYKNSIVAVIYIGDDDEDNI